MGRVKETCLAASAFAEAASIADLETKFLTSKLGRFIQNDMLCIAAQSDTTWETTALLTKQYLDHCSSCEGHDTYVANHTDGVTP